MIKALTQQPYTISFTNKDSFELVVHAKFGGTMHSNENEQYFPLMVTGFEPLSDAKQIYDEMAKWKKLQVQ